jgi:hypothetical protein
MAKQLPLFAEPPKGRPIGEFVLRACAACGQAVYALPSPPAADVRCHRCVSAAKKRSKR